MELQIKHIETNTGGRWEAQYPPSDERVGFMSYTNGKDGHIVIDHTVVPPKFSGQGIASQLLQTAIKFMRENNIRTLPTCSFVRDKLQNNPEWHDVLDPVALSN